MSDLNEVVRFDMEFLSAPFLMSTKKQVLALRKKLITTDRTVVFNGIPLNDLRDIYAGRENLPKYLKALARVIKMTRGNNFEIPTNADVYPGFAFEVYINYFELYDNNLDFKVDIMNSADYSKYGLFNRFIYLVAKVFVRHDEFHKWYFTDRAKPSMRLDRHIERGLVIDRIQDIMNRKTPDSRDSKATNIEKEMDLF